MNPNAEQAYQFAQMVLAGLPAPDAVRYFLPEDAVVDSLNLTQLGQRWQAHRDVAAAMVRLQKGDWVSLSGAERIKLALDKHYNEMAYFLYTHNFAEITHPQLQAKSTACRMALEAKVAGTAGKMNELTRFWDDLATGKASLAPARPISAA